MPIDPAELKRLRKRIDEELARADIDEPVRAELARNFRNEYRLLADRNWEAIQRFAKRTGIILAALVVIGLATAVVSGLLLGGEHKLAKEAKHLAGQNASRIKDVSKLAGEVVQSRSFSVSASCLEENERHDRARTGLRELLVKVQRKPPTSAELSHLHKISDEFVKVLVPEYNCAERLERFTTP